MSTLAPSPSTTETSPPAPEGSARSDVPNVPIWRLSVDAYHTMVDAGILESGAPVELLQGWLVKKMTKNRQHSFSTRALRTQLEALIPDGWDVETQEPITTDDSEPEPDVFVVKGTWRDYVDRHPQSHEVGLVAEVAHTSLSADRGIKKRVYAAAGIPVYWIVNLVDCQIEVFSEPDVDGPTADYAKSDVFQPGQSIPLLLDGNTIGVISVDQVLPGQ